MEMGYRTFRQVTGSDWEGSVGLRVSIPSDMIPDVKDAYETWTAIKNSAGKVMLRYEGIETQMRLLVRVVENRQRKRMGTVKS